MTAFDELVTSLVTGGMEPATAAALVARAVIEATAKPKTAGAARTARWRERHKTSQNVTGASSCSTVTVTSQASQSVTSDAVESESAPLSILPSLTESLEKKELEVLNTEPRAKVKRGARLPDDWQPSDADMKLASDRGLRLVEIEIEATKFRNYWTNRTDRQASKPRWDRAWENWILNVRKAPNGQERSVVAASDRLNAKLAEFSKPDLLGGVRGEAGASYVRLLPPGRSG